MFRRTPRRGDDVSQGHMPAFSHIFEEVESRFPTHHNVEIAVIVEVGYADLYARPGERVSITCSTLGLFCLPG